MQAVPVGLAEEAAVARRRRQELYKYFTPPPDDAGATEPSIPDPVLTAHAQLVAWRLNCSRAMVSLIDQDIQYFVAEASKTLHLEDNSLYDEPSDAIWAGCVAVPKGGRLCEHTIAQLPRENGSPAYFEVLDLREDERFSELPFVTGAPSFRYYCGVPLNTKHGTPIGSLFALDIAVRSPISSNEVKFLTKMAENVMVHYDNLKEKHDRKRMLNMNMCLAAFVDPENQIKRKKSDGMGKSKRSGSVAHSPHDPTDGNSSPHLNDQRHRSEDSSDATVSSHGSVAIAADDNIETFRRAADLLHAALALDQGGGVIFMDTATVSYRNRHQLRASDESSVGGESEVETQGYRRGSVDNPTLHSSSSWKPPQPAGPPHLQPSTIRTADVLAATTSPNANRRSGGSFLAMSHEDLARLIRRHPRGKLFDLNPMSYTASSSDDAVYDIPKAKATPSKREAQLLENHFPGAGQVIFLPLWDSTSSRFSTLFAYSNSDFRMLSSSDFLYSIAFSNCVSTEMIRIATQAADQQKSDFIGSISHELRSPLHGILASCEFLTDTETSSFQQSLIDTADSCARTLLDTISMVLDYSKINAFERDARKARKKSGATAAVGQPQLNIFGAVDLANVTEEVVEGVATGQVFKDSLTGVDAIDFTDATRNAYSGRREVEIILDIVPRARPIDWIFITQPGAFRRIIMNLFGNALKYTRTGYIRVKLEVQNPRRTHGSHGADESATTFVKLTVTDTGQGMSPQFMRTKLYTPFAQENSIAPGTGLGLSLVKSMVTMLNAEIHIESTLNVGTEVTVIFPMTLSSTTMGTDSESGSTPTSAGSIERVKDQSLTIVQTKARGRRVALFPERLTENDIESSRLVRHAINRYLTGWYGFETCSFSMDNLPDIIITDVTDLANLLHILPGALHDPVGPMIIVLCTTATRKSDKSLLAKSPRIEAVNYPFGPFKLARSIKWCLEKMERLLVAESDGETQAAIAPVEEEQTLHSSVEETTTAIDHLTLQSSDPRKPSVHVIQAGTMAANEDSVHAQLVIDSSTDSSSSAAHLPERPEFPFPHEPKEDGTVSPSVLEGKERDRPPLSSRKTISPTRPEITAQHAEPATPTSSKGTLFASANARRGSKAGAPRLLLVDDNKVNLRLLQTFMKKRNYLDVFSAEDGSQAVAIYRDLITQTPPHPPDIIFMDISMPVMNGFQATREIRDMERDFREQIPSPMQTPASSLIIALTGLASGRDQSEAFTSGFDLFLTKPTSFREVGRLLDNWEKNGNPGAAIGVPHGAVTGEAQIGIED